MSGPRDGWHWKEWSAEFAGTAVLMFAVVTAKYWAVRAGPPTAGLGARIAIVGTVAGLVVIAIAVSPLGRRSGAHLNPAVTLGLWLQRVTGRADLAGYCLAQIAGGILGVLAARLWGPQVAAPGVRWALIAPDGRISPVGAAAIEAAATSAQLVIVFLLLTSRRYQRWTPVVAGALLAGAVVGLARISGAGFNPVRGLSSDVAAGAYPSIWIYFAGPLLGAALAAMTIRGRPTTGKLCHDPAIECHMRCELPHRAAHTASEDR